MFGKGVRGCDTADRAALVPERPVLVWVRTDTGTPEGHPRTRRPAGWGAGRSEQELLEP